MATIDLSNVSGATVNTQVIDWVSLVAETEGQDFPNYEHDTYEFSRKTFREDDSQGVYV